MVCVRYNTSLRGMCVTEGRTAPVTCAPRVDAGVRNSMLYVRRRAETVVGVCVSVVEMVTKW